MTSKIFNKKASVGNLLMDNIVYLLILMVFILGIFGIIWKQSNNASFWEEYYAKEIVKVVDLVKEGDEVLLDIHKATEIAKKNNVGFDEIFQFNNIDNKLCVKLSKSGKSCYYYFNDVSVIEPKIKYKLDVPINLLSFKIGKSEK